MKTITMMFSLILFSNSAVAGYPAEIKKTFRQICYGHNSASANATNGVVVIVEEVRKGGKAAEEARFNRRNFPTRIKVDTVPDLPRDVHSIRPHQMDATFADIYNNHGIQTYDGTGGFAFDRVGFRVERNDAAIYARIEFNDQRSLGDKGTVTINDEVHTVKCFDVPDSVHAQADPDYDGSAWEDQPDTDYAGDLYQDTSA